MWASGSDKHSVEITIILIVVSSLVTIVVRRTKRDKCLKDFSRYPVTLEMTDGATCFGRLHVENTGIELAYADKRQRESGNTEASYILSKDEYLEIQGLACFHADLDEESREDRRRDLERTYKPSTLRKLTRKTRNLLNTVRDSFLEVVNLLIGQDTSQVRHAMMYRAKIF